MPTGISGLYKNTKGAKIARGEKIKQTNFERIKAMSVEEMAEFIEAIVGEIDCGYCPAYSICKVSDGCKANLEKWLFSDCIESEVQEDEVI